MHLRLRLLAIVLCLLPASIWAQSELAMRVEANGSPPLAQTMDAIVVSGVQPGPGLWRVSKGEHEGERVMWVIGSLTPVPRRMQWEPREVEQVLAGAQEVLLPPRVKLKKSIGMVRGMLLLPAAMGSRKNPDKEKLVDVLPADVYARWVPLKAKYIGRSKGIENQRPLFAAYKLYEKAVKRTGLSLDGVVLPVVTKAAKKAKIPSVRPEIEIDIPDPRQAIRDFANNSVEDVDCFTKTLDRVESDLGTMRERANAWATGDIEVLRALPFIDQNQICADAVLNASVSRDRGLDDLRARLAQAWLEAAEAAMERNQVTFAVLPMAEILKPDGYIETLRSRGYHVEAP